MKITVQFFSFLRQITGQTELPVELPANSTIGDLRQELYRQFPKLRETEKTILVAIGVEFAAPNQRLREGDVVSFMPPLQGGVDGELLVTDQPISSEAVAGDVGGVVIFWGIVRDKEDGVAIRALEYSAYREMAEDQLRKIIDETKRHWPLNRIRVVHRLGEIPVGEASLLVRVEAAHRGEAFAAAQFLIDELKQKAPIWKRGIE